MITNERQPTLADRLLASTIARAVSGTKLYNRLYSNIRFDKIIAVEDLKHLPLVSKKMLLEAGEDAVNWSLNCAAIQNTSGTTGQPLFLHRSWEEFEFISKFFERRVFNKLTDDDRPLILNMDVPGHGTPTPVPTGAFIVNSCITDEFSTKRTIEYLKRHYSIPGVVNRVCAITGSVTQVNELTSYLVNRGIDPQQFEVQQMALTSDHLSAANRHSIESLWGCKVLNRLSWSEFLGGAEYCDRCSAFHFDPTLIPEIVAMESDSLVEKGKLGRLVLTGLFPFAQMQPLIRYLSDDIMQSSFSICGRPAYHYYGRVSHALLTSNSTKVLLPGALLYEVLDKFPCLQRTQDVSINNEFYFRGKPVVMGNVSDKIKLFVGMRDEMPTEICSKMANLIRLELINGWRPLAELTNEGTYFEVVSLDSSVKARPTFHRQSCIWNSNQQSL